MWREAALTSTVGVTILWIAFCLYHHPPKIEAALQSESTAAVAVAGFSDVRPSAAGRRIVLEGSVPSAELRDQAERVVLGIRGVTGVDNHLSIPVATAPELPPFLEISTRPAGVTLRGPVASRALRDELVKLAAELFTAVDDRLVVDPAADHGTATARAASVLSALARAGPEIRVRLQGESLRLSGTVASEEQRRRIERRVQAAADDVRLFFSTLAVTEPPPEAAASPPS